MGKRPQKISKDSERVSKWYKEAGGVVVFPLAVGSPSSCTLCPTGVNCKTVDTHWRKHTSRTSMKLSKLAVECH